MERDDELARTATAASSPPAAVTPLGATLGRYRLERPLGVGGMGVVHAAFDPDLERRVALKVLRSAASGDEARARLLREARAMARLAHPNVVVVHEVGSAGGRDYVAMELVDGSTVDEWSREAPRSEREILEVFAAAGRGLAAAHAAGLVHRDFKPHNVLRGRDGRVVVTDFGLARGVDAPTDPMAETPTVAPAQDATTPSSLSALTRTGSVLGTPAYMAPEQWRGIVGPASDQFAYCVALWEALAGRRPFRGDSAEALRAQVERGADLDELARLPKRVRAALRRGLDPDSARRWPTMDALLAELDAARAAGHVPMVAAVASLAAVAALASVVIALTRGGSPAVEPAPVGAVASFVCPPPAMQPDTVWPAGALAAMTAAGQGYAAQQLDRDVARWRAARGAACAAGESGKEQRTCLDHVLARLDAVARGVGPLGAGEHVDAAQVLVDPAVCAAKPIPRLESPSPQMRVVLARVLHESVRRGAPDLAELEALLDKSAADPCASALAAHLAATAAEVSTKAKALSERATTDAARCVDERVRADIALAQASEVVSLGLLDVSMLPKVQLAEAAVARVSQSDLVGELDALRTGLSQRDDEIDDAIVHADASSAGYAARGRVSPQIRMAREALKMRIERGHPEDLADEGRQYAELRGLAVAAFGEHDSVVHDLDRALAMEAFARGEVEAAHRRLAEVREESPQEHARRITGHVVDASGAPVGGATVHVGPLLILDAHGVMQLNTFQRTTTTDATGAFTFDDAPRDGAIVAETETLRAWPAPIADAARIVLGPTMRLHGRVELNGVAPRNVTIQARTPAYPQLAAFYVAPVDREGNYDLPAVPRGEADLMAVADREYGPGVATVRVHGEAPDLVRALAVPVSARVVHVLVRSTVGVGPGNAQVVMVRGKVGSSVTVNGLIRSVSIETERFARVIDPARSPAAVVAQAKAGDLFVTLRHVGTGDVHACAIAVPTEAEDADFQRKIDESFDKLSFQCVPIPPGTEVVTVMVPPWPRLD